MWRTGRLRGAGVVVIGLLALVLGAQPAWLHAKAALAQWLLLRSWHGLVEGELAAAPWPGADTRPVARLGAPAHGIDQIVLAGDSGRTLAFGPGWAEASAPPNTVGTTVISAHRDTHFAFLRHVRDGDVLTLQAGTIETGTSEKRWHVVHTEIVDSRDQRIDTGTHGDRLVLVTCWPFDAPTAGGPLRYVVVAEPVPD